MKVAEINQELVGKKVSFSYNHTEATGKIVEVSSDNKSIVIAFDYFIRCNMQEQNAAIFKAGKLGLSDGNLRTVILLPENLQPSKEELKRVQEEDKEEISFKEEMINLLGGYEFLKEKNFKILGECERERKDFKNDNILIKGIYLAIPTNSYKANRCYFYKRIDARTESCYDIIFTSEWTDKKTKELISNKKHADYSQTLENAIESIFVKAEYK